MKILFGLIILATVNCLAANEDRLKNDVIMYSTAAIGDSSAANSCSVLDVKSTSKGFLAPRMSTSQKNAISSPVSGLMVYDSTLSKYQYWDGTSYSNMGGGTFSLNGQTGTTQIFSNDANVTITSSNNTHALSWSSVLGTGRGGTGAPINGNNGAVVFTQSSSAFGITAVGTSGQLLQSVGAGTPVWVNPVAPGGSSTQFQFNNSGAFAGSSSLIWDATNNSVSTRTVIPQADNTYYLGNGIGAGGYASINTYNLNDQNGSYTIEAYNRTLDSANGQVMGWVDNGIQLYGTDFGSSGGHVGLLVPHDIGPSVDYTLPSVDGSSGQFLKTNGSAILSWADASISLNSQTGSTQIFANDTNVIITSSNNTHTLGFAGTLSLSKGGTGANLSASAGGAVYSTGSALAITARGTSGQVLTSAGGSAPTWSNSDGRFFSSQNQTINSSDTINSSTGMNTVFAGVISPAVQEVSQIVVTFSSAIDLQSTYFLINRNHDIQTDYFWFNVDGGGTDPSLGGGDGDYEVDILSTDNPTQVSAKLRTRAGLVGYYGRSGSDPTLILTNPAPGGTATDIADGTAPTGFTLSTTTQGVDAITGTITAGTITAGINGQLLTLVNLGGFDIVIPVSAGVQLPGNANYTLPTGGTISFIYSNIQGGWMTTSHINN